MPLPKIVTPEYTTILPSTGEKVTYRPFLVKEEKLFLIAQEEGNEKSLISAVKKIIKSCVKSKTKVEDMAMFDVEFLFLNLRARSEGEEIELTLICPDDGTTEVDVTINIDDINVVIPENHTNQIDISEDMKLVMRYPNIDSALKMKSGDESVVENAFKMTELCLKEIYCGEDVYDFQNYSSKEKTEFIESIDPKSYKKLITSFFESMPTVKYEVEVINPNTNVKSQITLEGIQDFLS